MTRRRSGRVVREKCGCRHDDATYTEMCVKHAAEWRERHEQAARDYQRQKEAQS